jgi:predicted signal transduction protein with EAL and GGDEF domain
MEESGQVGSELSPSNAPWRQKSSSRKANGKPACKPGLTLTGALNRRGLTKTAREVLAARRKGSHLCLAMLDIDNFKVLNDTYKTGDSALSPGGRGPHQCQDTMARNGGEEL